MENQRPLQRAKYKVFMKPEWFYGMEKHPFVGTILSDSHTLQLSSPEGWEPHYNLVKKIGRKSDRLWFITREGYCNIRSLNLHPPFTHSPPKEHWLLCPPESGGQGMTFQEHRAEHRAVLPITHRETGFSLKLHFPTSPLRMVSRKVPIKGTCSWLSQHIWTFQSFRAWSGLLYQPPG